MRVMWLISFLALGFSPDYLYSQGLRSVEAIEAPQMSEVSVPQSGVACGKYFSLIIRRDTAYIAFRFYGQKFRIDGEDMPINGDYLVRRDLVEVRLYDGLPAPRGWWFEKVAGLGFRIYMSPEDHEPAKFCIPADRAPGHRYHIL